MIDLPGSRRQRIAMIALAIGTLVAAACSSGDFSSPPGLSSKALAANPSTGVRPATITYSFQTVNDQSGSNTHVTDVDNSNNRQKISGFYYSSGNYHSFISKQNASGGYTNFTPRDYSGFNTFLYGLTDGTSSGYEREVGYGVSQICNISCQTIGLSYDSSTSSWTQLQDPSQGTEPCNVTEALAINDSRIAVGFYEKNSGSGCVKQAFEEYDYGSGQKFVDINPSPAPLNQSISSTTANGINSLGDVVGTATMQSGQTYGWYYSVLSYFIFSNGTLNTYALGVNFPGAVVGNYVDTAGTHGFLIRSPENNPPNFITVDYTPNNFTILNAINQSWEVSGWTQDSSGSIQGLLGTCSGCPANALRRGLQQRPPPLKSGRPKSRSISGESTP